MRDMESRLGAVAANSPFGSPPTWKYERLIANAKQVPPATTIVAYPCDETSLRGPIEAAEAGIIVPILVGPAAKIASVARGLRLNIDRFEIVDVPDSEAAARSLTYPRPECSCADALQGLCQPERR